MENALPSLRAEASTFLFLVIAPSSQWGVAMALFLLEVTALSSAMGLPAQSALKQDCGEATKLVLLRLQAVLTLNLDLLTCTLHHVGQELESVCNLIFLLHHS